MSALFQPEISSIESQIAQLQARLAAFNEAEVVADGVLQAVQGGVQKLSPIGTEAIARLKEKIISLFNSGDSGDDGGNKPVTPTPQPPLDGQYCEFACCLEDCPPTSLKGQAVDWAYPLARPLCCLMEDCPQSSLKGQSVDLGQIAFSRDGFKYVDDAIAVETSTTLDTPKEQNYFELIPLSGAVGYFRNSQTGEIVCTYLGGNNKQKLKMWGEWLCNQHSVGSRFQLREAERLTAFKYEIKIWGMSLKQIQRLAESNTTKNPPSNFGTAPKRKPEPVAPLPKPLQIEDIEVGDIVRSTTVKNWTYVVLAKMENGMLDCQRNNTPEGTPEIRLAVHPGAVELVAKGTKVEASTTPQVISININEVPVGMRLERTDDALLAEYRVWVWAIVRVFGKPEVQQKCIGKLIETIDGISASRPHGSSARIFQDTTDALKYLMQGAGLKLADVVAAYNRHQEEVGLASIQPQPVHPEQKIEANDWVELLCTGDRYQVAEVDNEGIHLNTNDGTILVQPDEVTLLMKIPASWQPF